eukprot:3527352-Rhodomonas_salina.1
MAGTYSTSSSYWCCPLQTRPTFGPRSMLTHTSNAWLSTRAGGLDIVLRLQPTWLRHHALSPGTSADLTLLSAILNEDT